MPAVDLICALVLAFDALARPAAHFPDQFASTAVGFVLERRHGFPRLEEGEGTSDGRLRPARVNDDSSTIHQLSMTVTVKKMAGSHCNAPVQEQGALGGVGEREVAPLCHA